MVEHPRLAIGDEVRATDEEVYGIHRGRVVGIGVTYSHLDPHRPIPLADVRWENGAVIRLRGMSHYAVEVVA